jgi:hypothetical protein
MKRPRGKLRPDDQGALEMRFAVQDDALVIIFPYPIDWLGLSRREVEGLIELLGKKLQEMPVEASPEATDPSAS